MKELPMKVNCLKVQTMVCHFSYDNSLLWIWPSIAIAAGFCSLLFRFGIPSCEIASGCEKHHNFCTVVVIHPHTKHTIRNLL